MNKFGWACLLIPFCLVTLTGCPGQGDRMNFDETALIHVVGDKVCFLVADALDYQPADMGINRRGTLAKKKHFVFNPDLKVTDGELCLPPSFYRFPQTGQFLIEYILVSKKGPPRKVVVALEIVEGRISSVPPDDSEMARPYSEMLQNQ